MSKSTKELNEYCDDMYSLIKNEDIKKRYGEKMKEKCKEYLIPKTEKTCPLDKLPEALKHKSVTVDINKNSIREFFRIHEKINDYRHENRFTFEDQEGIDVGGLTRMFWNNIRKDLLKAKIFTKDGGINPNFDDFDKYIELDKYKVQVNKLVKTAEERLLDSFKRVYKEYEEKRDDEDYVSNIMKEFKILILTAVNMQIHESTIEHIIKKFFTSQVNMKKELKDKMVDLINYLYGAESYDSDDSSDDTELDYDIDDVSRYDDDIVGQYQAVYEDYEEERIDIDAYKLRIREVSNRNLVEHSKMIIIGSINRVLRILTEDDANNEVLAALQSEKNRVNNDEVSADVIAEQYELAYEDYEDNRIDIDAFKTRIEAISNINRVNTSKDVIIGGIDLLLDILTDNEIITIMENERNRVSGFVSDQEIIREYISVYEDYMRNIIDRDAFKLRIEGINNINRENTSTEVIIAAIDYFIEQLTDIPNDNRVRTIMEDERNRVTGFDFMNENNNEEPEIDNNNNNEEPELLDVPADDEPEILDDDEETETEILDDDEETISEILGYDDRDPIQDDELTDVDQVGGHLITDKEGVYKEYKFYHLIGQMYAKSLIIKQPIGIKLSFNTVYGLKYDRSKMTPADYFVLYYLENRDDFKSSMKKPPKKEELEYFDFLHINPNRPSIKVIWEPEDLKVTEKNYHELLLIRSKMVLDYGAGKSPKYNIENKLLGFNDGFRSLIDRSVFKNKTLYQLKRLLEGDFITEKQLKDFAKLLRKKYEKEIDKHSGIKLFIEMLEDYKDYIIDEYDDEKEDKKVAWLQFMKRVIEFMKGDTNLDLGLGYSLIKANTPKNSTPVAHTCFNQVDLPEYTDIKTIIAQFKKAIFEAPKGTTLQGGGKNYRKHRGINKNTGRLNKGYKYSGKKLKSGIPEIVKVKKQIKMKIKKVGGKKLISF